MALSVSLRSTGLLRLAAFCGAPRRAQQKQGTATVARRAGEGRVYGTAKLNRAPQPAGEPKRNATIPTIPTKTTPLPGRLAYKTGEERYNPYNSYKMNTPSRAIPASRGGIKTVEIVAFVGFVRFAGPAAGSAGVRPDTFQTGAVPPAWRWPRDRGRRGGILRSGRCRGPAGGPPGPARRRAKGP